MLVASFPNRVDPIFELLNVEGHNGRIWNA